MGGKVAAAPFGKVAAAPFGKFGAFPFAAGFGKAAVVAAPVDKKVPFGKFGPAVTANSTPSPWARWPLSARWSLWRRPLWQHLWPPRRWWHLAPSTSSPTDPSSEARPPVSLSPERNSPVLDSLAFSKKDVKVPRCKMNEAQMFCWHELLLMFC